MTAQTNQSSVTDIETQTPTETAEKKSKRATAGAAAAELKGSNADDQLGGKKVTLTVFGEKGEGGMDAVQVGLNGFMYLIPRNKPCLVPIEVAWVIRDAQTTQMSTGEGGKQIEQIVPRYAYQITE